MKVRAFSWFGAGVCLLAFVLSQSTKTFTSQAVLDTPPRWLAAARGAAQPSLVVVPEAAKARALEAYGRLPLSFEVNRGQTDRRVKFLSHGSGYSLFLTPTEAVLALKKPASPAGKGAQRSFARRGGLGLTRIEEAAAQSTPDAALRIKLVGANPAPKVEGLEQLPGKVNYFLGNDPKKWRTNVPNYARVLYRDIYPGVDLVYYGDQQELEYDFVVAPGADPKAITLSFSGARNLELDAAGNLVVHTTSGPIRQQKPIIYQEVHGARQAVSGGYVLKGSRKLTFELGAYDAAKPLVIDPVLVYSTYLGGNSNDFGIAIAVDGDGNAYVTGRTFSRNFPTANPFQPAFNGGPNDAFVTKLNRDGSALVYSTYLGGTGAEIGVGIAVDEQGNAYITGATASRDFPLMNAFQSVHRGGPPGMEGDAFVTKLNRDGSALLYFSGK